MWAGTVVAPPGLTSAVTVSMTSRSRSVAFNDSSVTLERSSTLARIGIVLRRSTTRCTWDSDLSKSARSTVTFMRNPAYLGTQAQAPTPTLPSPQAGRVRWGVPPGHQYRKLPRQCRFDKSISLSGDRTTAWPREPNRVRAAPTLPSLAHGGG